MTTQHAPAHISPVQPPRRWPRRVGIAAAAVVALLVGVGIGAAASSDTGKLNTATRNLATSQHQVATLRSEAGTLRSQYSAAKNAAQQATSIADAKASAAYASRNAALTQRAKSLNQRAKAIAAEEGMLQSSQIIADGVYVVGQDIKAGTYHTNGDGGQDDNAYYYATLNSTNTSDISDNNNFDGPETVDLNGAYAFQISGPCTWVRIG